MSQTPNLENGETNRQINLAYQAKIRHLILFPLILNQNWPRLQKSLIYEVLDCKKGSSIDIDSFSFHGRRKARAGQYALMFHESFIAANIFLAANINYHNNSFQLLSITTAIFTAHIHLMDNVVDLLSSARSPNI